MAELKNILKMWLDGKPLDLNHAVAIADKIAE